MCFFNQQLPIELPLYAMCTDHRKRGDRNTINQKECEKNRDWICKIFDENIDEKTVYSA